MLTFDQNQVNYPRASVLIRDSESILMMHRFRDGNEYYVLPGGAVEEGENAEEAALRELKEETSIIGKIEKKVSEYSDPSGRVHYIFLCSRISGEPKLPEDSPERMIMNKDNQFEPMWVKLERIPSLKIYPEGTAEYLRKLL
jgi:8-oxo-dGTP pyrophosphatase MutT (NUDIX family)